MYLKSLALRGFKSFASTTTLQLEPGITCVVGPNGSGKSNVVDALAWVMGEQGAKSLRGGKMEDVIFAGTAGRPPLGRAEVSLTIDNSDGVLPIEYAEVTISRTMFRSGGSEYAINGRSCRLLDVQELLSDSGIGREMHVIVGQGQLDSILHATPEDRRGFIEEAAGVLKHRKRKEKALRKLDSTEGNLTRLTDLLTELRRQLKPLGRQAEAARKAAVIQADVRDARARLLADDLLTAQTILARELAEESLLVERRAAVERELAQARHTESRSEEELRDGLPDLARAQETWFALSGIRERLRGTAVLAAERVRNAAAEPELPPGRDPAELLRQAEALRGEEQRMSVEADQARALLDAATARRQSAETEHAAEEQRVAAALRAAADRREGLARLVGQVQAKRSRVAAAEDEIGRLSGAQAEARGRAEHAERAFTRLEMQVAGLDAGEQGLDAEHEVAAAALADVEHRLAKAHDEARAADRERAGLAARCEALSLGLNRRDGAGALLAATPPVSGLLGSVAALLTVRAGFETAVAVALGAAADAVAVAGLDTALDTVGLLREDELGRAALLVAASPSDPSDPGPARAAAGCGESTPVADAIWALDVVSCAPELTPAVQRLLGDVLVVADLAAARRVVAERPGRVAVTQAGELVGSDLVVGGAGSSPSLLEVQAAVDETQEALTTVTHTCERLTFEATSLEQERVDAERRVDIALARLHESDARLAAVAEELAQHGARARSASEEAERLAQAATRAAQGRDQERAALAGLEERLAAAEVETGHHEVPDVRERLGDAARAARAAETEARLALRTVEERARALAGRAEAAVRGAEQERSARARAEARRERLRREGRIAEAVAIGTAEVLDRVEGALGAAAAERSAVEERRRVREEELREARTRARQLEQALADLVASVHRDELERAQQRMRVEQLEERAVEELGIEPDLLVADFGPDRAVPVLAADEHGEPTQADPVPYRREEQERRLRAAERELARLGRVNPLALEEYAALEERNRFLTEQLDDLRRTRRDLLGIVAEVDEQVEQVFTAAWEDVRTQFAEVFARLFPGGEGRLVLTDPEQMLTTGVDVEARPAGKKVKRLSLLSGGERALVAVAFLVSLFKARPSPFYILDEVEAALDDTNLGRLLEIYEELRESSQLLVVTHQKRSMEVANALYGVTMRGDGVSTVISQRMREPEAVR